MSELRRCKRCRNVFTYGGPEKLGYSEEFCGAYCDGFYHGRLSLTADREQLLELVRSAYNEGFGEGMKEHTSHRGGKPWRDSKSSERLAAHTRRTLLGEK